MGAGFRFLPHKSLETPCLIPNWKGTISNKCQMMKFNPRHLILAMILACSCLPICAQGIWQPGYLVGLSGDTLTGQILNKDWRKSPTSIQYKDSSIEKTVSLHEIKAFGFWGGDEYEQIQVRLDVTPVKLDELKYVDEPQYKEGKWLTRLIVRGAISLFYLKDEKSKVHYLVKTPDGSITELIVRRELMRKDGRFYVNNRDHYKGQIRVMTYPGCPDLEPRINKLSYSEKSLGEFIYKYNVCMNPDDVEAVSVRKKSKNNVLVKGYLIGGMSMNRVHLLPVVKTHMIGSFYAGSTNLYPEMKLGFSPHYTAGLGGQFILPGGHQNWSLLGEVLYKPMRLTEETVDYFGEEFNLDYRLNYVRFLGMTRREFGQQKLRTFVQFGFGLGLLDSHSADVEKLFRGFQEHEEIALTGFGGRIEDVEVEFRAEVSRGVENEMDAISNVTSLYVLLKYRF